MSSCPSSFCTLRKSTRRFNRWVAKEWRRTCGETRAGEMPALTARFFKFLKKLSRVTCPETAVLEGNSHGDLRRQDTVRAAPHIPQPPQAPPAPPAPVFPWHLCRKPESPFFKIDAIYRQRHQFRHPQTAGIHQRQHRFQPAVGKIRFLFRRQQQPFYFPRAQNFGSGFSCRATKRPPPDSF